GPHFRGSVVPRSPTWRERSAADPCADSGREEDSGELAPSPARLRQRARELSGRRRVRVNAMQPALLLVLGTALCAQTADADGSAERSEPETPVVDEHGAAEANSLDFVGCILDPNAPDGGRVLVPGACGAADDLRGAQISSFDSHYLPRKLGAPCGPAGAGM